MKCPSCGAETTGKICEFCGSEMPKENINITNNYYGEAPAQEMNQNAKAGTCPKCGSTKINFKRERVGSSSQSSSRKKYVGNGRKGQSVSKSSYRTIGLCQNCGYTWNPNAGTNSTQTKTGAPMWLWVLGWICIFPVPLTILMLRKKDMKPAIKYSIIAVAWIVYLLIGFSGGSSDNKSDIVEDSSIEVNNSVTDNIDVIAENTDTAQNADMIYELNDDINIFVNNYNKANPDEPITKEMCKPYHHHGQDHNDQIRYTVNDFEVVISGGVYSSSINFYIGYTPGDSHTNDDYKEMFKKYIKGFDLGIDDAQIDADWDAVMNDLTNNVRFDSYEVDVNMFNDNIEYMKVTKNRH